MKNITIINNKQTLSQDDWIALGLIFRFKRIRDKFDSKNNIKADIETLEKLFKDIKMLDTKVMKNILNMKNQ